MAPDLQGKLLRVLETSRILRVGSSESVAVDVRVIAATNRDPAKLVQDGRLREDLYYRLNVFPIPLPPLRQRGEDIELLADHFLAHLNARDDTKKQWSPEARAGLMSYAWPGNVRELKNSVERAAILADQFIRPELLPGSGESGTATYGRSAPRPDGGLTGPKGDGDRQGAATSDHGSRGRHARGDRAAADPGHARRIRRRQEADGTGAGDLAQDALHAPERLPRRGPSD